TFVRVDGEDHEVGEPLCAAYLFQDLEMIELVHCPGASRLLTKPIRLTEDRDLVRRRGLSGRGTCRAPPVGVAEDGHVGAFGDGAHLLEDCHLLRVDDLCARRSQYADARSRRNIGVLVERNRARLKGRRSEETTS